MKHEPLLLLDADQGSGTGATAPATPASPSPDVVKTPAPETTPVTPSEGNDEAPGSEIETVTVQTVTSGFSDFSNGAASEQPVDQAAAALVTKAKLAALTPATPDEFHPLNNAECFLKRLEARAYDDTQSALTEAANTLRALLALIRNII